jgi:hypothetical protein
MNSAVQDADNLAWKLALAWRGLAPDALLDTYHAERHPAAVENLRITGNTMRFLAPPNALMRLRRNLILRASRFRWVRRHVDSGRLSEPFAYAGSPIVDGDGAVVPDRPVMADGRSTRLRHRLGAAFVLAMPEAEAVATHAPVPLSMVVDESLDSPILVRPDGHLAARLASLSDLDRALAHATASPSIDAGWAGKAE